MNYYLHKYTYNWADEIDFYGFETITEEKLNKRKEIIKKLKALGDDCPELWASVGTNEEIEEISIDELEEYADELHMEVISEEQYKALEIVRGNCDYPLFEEVADRLENYDETREIVKKYNRS